MNLSKLLSDNVEIVSFDLFDTLVDRQGYGIDDLLEVTAQYALRNWRWVSSVNKDQLRHARFHTCSLIQRTGRKVEMHARDAWTQIVSNKCIEQKEEWEEIVTEIVKFELSLDRLLLTVKPHTLETIKAVKEAGKKVIIFSDMYFSSKELLTIPAVAQVVNEVDGFYVSYDLQVKKSNGSAFTFLKDELGVPPARVMHVGDNSQSDVIIPKKMGFQCKLYCEKVPTPRPDTNPAHFLDAIKVGLNAASLRLGFRIVEWCRRNKTTHVALIARDGTIFKSYIEEASEFLHYPVQCLDLQVDRFSLEIASFLSSEDDIPPFITWILEKEERQTRFKKILTEHGKGQILTEIQEQKALPKALHVDLFTILDRLRGGVLAHIQGSFPSLDNMALIDIGYGGSVMRLISNLILSFSAHSSARIAFFSLIQNAHFHHNESASQPNLTHYECVLDWSRLHLQELTNFAMLEPWFKDRSRGEACFIPNEAGDLIPQRLEVETYACDQDILESKTDFDTRKGAWEKLLIAYSDRDFSQYAERLYTNFNHPHKFMCTYYVNHLPSECPEKGGRRSVVYTHEGGEFPTLKQLLEADYWVEASLVYNDRKIDLGKIKELVLSEPNSCAKLAPPQQGHPTEFVSLPKERVTIKRRIARLRRKLEKKWKKQS